MRSTLRATTLALLISGLGSIASAQAPIKIAFVNSQALMEAAPGRQAATDLLTKEGQGYQSQLQKMQDSINGLLTKYQKDEPTLSAAAKDTKQKAIQALETKVLQIKATGDKAGAEKLKTEFVDGKNDFAKIRDVVTERWLRAPKATFVYSLKF